MPKILFFSEAVSLAHVARPVQLAKALGNEWEVFFACAQQYEFCFNDTNWARYKISSISPNLFFERLKKGSPLFFQDELRAYAKEDLSIILKLKPDIIVGDLRFSLSAAARVAAVPYLSICNAHWSPWAKIGSYPLPDIPLTHLMGPKIASVLFRIGYPFAFKLHSRPLNAVRAFYGLPPLKDLRFTYTDSDMTLFPDTPGLVPTQDLPYPHRYIGPIIWSPRIPEPPWWEKLPTNSMLAYVTLGSTGSVELLSSVLEVLEEYGFITIVATAGRKDIPPINGKRFVSDFLPGEAIASLARIVVCNGGSATAYQALAKGKPVIGICSNMDQFLTMTCVERTGSGL